MLTKYFAQWTGGFLARNAIDVYFFFFMFFTHQRLHKNGSRFMKRFVKCRLRWLLYLSLKTKTARITSTCKCVLLPICKKSSGTIRLTLRFGKAKNNLKVTNFQSHCYRHTGSHFIFARRRRKIIRKVLFRRRQRFFISSGRLAYNIQVILAVQHVSYFLIFQWATYFHFLKLWFLSSDW